MQKTTFNVNDHQVVLSMPISKVDKENRLVSGFATLDNEDQQNDRVTKEASEEAFTNFYGNIREMHQPIAVGRLVKFENKSFYDPDAKREYNGIYVTARVSKGAEDAWQKVLDGTLTGFSIKGEILKSHPEGDFRVITKYELDELSLVDRPANALAKIMAIEKVDGNSVIKGMVADTKISNVFYCETDKLAYTEQAEKAACGMCGESNEAIGWVEESGNRNEQIQNVLLTKGIITNEPSPTVNVMNVAIDTDTIVEKVLTTLAAKTGGQSMAKDDTAVAEKVDEAVESNDEATEVEDNTETEETVETEEAVKGVSLEDFGRDLVQQITKSFTDAIGELKGKDESLESSVEELKKGLTEATEEINSKISDLGERLESVENSGAVKKSAEDSTEEKEIRKSVFSGSAFDVLR